MFLSFSLPTYLNIDLNLFWPKFNLLFMNFTQIMLHEKIPLKQSMPCHIFPLINVMTL